MKMKYIGIIVCIVVVLLLAWRSTTASTNAYWIYLIAGSLLGVLAGVFRNMDRWKGQDDS